RRQKRRGRYNEAGHFKIVEFENPNGGVVYRVSGYKLNGERVRKNCETRDEALAKKQELEIAEANQETAARPVVTRLTPEQAAEAEACFARLKASSLKLTLVQALDFAIENYREPVKEITLKCALGEFINERTAANDRPLTIRNLKQRVGSIVDDQP